MEFEKFEKAKALKKEMAEIKKFEDSANIDRPYVRFVQKNSNYWLSDIDYPLEQLIGEADTNILQDFVSMYIKFKIAARKEAIEKEFAAL